MRRLLPCSGNQNCLPKRALILPCFLSQNRLPICALILPCSLSQRHCPRPPCCEIQQCSWRPQSVYIHNLRQECRPTLSWRCESQPGYHLVPCASCPWPRPLACLQCHQPQFVTDRPAAFAKSLRLHILLCPPSLPVFLCRDFRRLWQYFYRREQWPVLPPVEARLSSPLLVPPTSWLHQRQSLRTRQPRCQ